MILVIVRQEYRVEMTDIRPQHLRPEIRPRIDKNRHPLMLHQHARPEPLVLRVGTAADLALASDHRNSL